MKKATLQTIARDVRAIARSVAAQKPANQPALKVVPLGKHELDVGLTVYENRPCRLIVLENLLDGIEPTTWAEAQAYAKKYNALLPTRIDGLVLFERAKAKFKTDKPYWTCEEYAGVSDCAWGQWFGNGYQDGWGKGYECRVCLVRRSPI